MTKSGSHQYSYRSAGVDIDAGNALVAKIAPLAAATARPGADAALGGFGGLFDLAACGFKDPILIGATDGVGTKLLLAEGAGHYHGLGIDLVAMCVNDLVVQGAEPLFFLDYFATGRLDREIAGEVVAGIAEGCRQSGCALIGGETAEMPGLYQPGAFDLAGFAVGAVERGALLTGADIAPGYVVLGLGASGLHANGFSLIRRLIEGRGLDLDGPAPFDPAKTLREALLEPTRIYVASLRAALRHGIRGLAHITGGGLIENLPRVLPTGTRAVIDAASWPLPPVCRWLAEEGVAAGEMSRTFNCGIGMAVVVGAGEAAAVEGVLAGAGETVHRIGEIVARRPGAPAITIEGTSAWPTPDRP